MSVRCPPCHGRGFLHDSSMTHDKPDGVKCFFCETCKNCKGQGVQQNVGYSAHVCFVCGGKGFQHNSGMDHDKAPDEKCFFCEKCKACGGDGLQGENRSQQTSFVNVQQIPMQRHGMHQPHQQQHHHPPQQPHQHQHHQQHHTNHTSVSGNLLAGFGDALNSAASLIQSSFRGHRTRKQLNNGVPPQQVVQNTQYTGPVYNHGHQHQQHPTYQHAPQYQQQQPPVQYQQAPVQYQQQPAPVQQYQQQPAPVQQYQQPPPQYAPAPVQQQPAPVPQYQHPAPVPQYQQPAPVQHQQPAPVPVQEPAPVQPEESKAAPITTVDPVTQEDSSIASTNTLPETYEDCHGTMELTVLRARDLFNSDSFGKQDPYCKIKAGGMQFKTKTHSSGGVNPSWDQKFTVPVDGSTSNNYVSIEIYDKDVGTDDFLGTVNVYIIDLIKTNNDQYKWYTVERRVDGTMVASGEICLSVQWHSNHQLVN